MAADGIALGLTRRSGMLADLTITRDGQVVKPLHRAYWCDEAASGASADPLLGQLQGDFLCAPFGTGGARSGVPPHGWTANGLWSELSRSLHPDGALEVTFGLDQPVNGASVTKTIGLRPGHPVVYQHHHFDGGDGRLPLAHHAMVHVPGGARLSFSRKAFGETPPTGLDPAELGTRSVLAYPQRFASLAEVGLANGGTADATSYPFAKGHEDFVALFDGPGASIGWSAAVAARDGFVFFAVKDARVLSQTFLWMSNGGRSYAPWNGRHTNVLGIEEGCSLFGAGQDASAADNALSEAGYPTSLPLGQPGGLSIRYALGAIPVPTGLAEVADIALAPGQLVLKDQSGASHHIPFDTGFFQHDEENQWLQ